LPIFPDTVAQVKRSVVAVGTFMPTRNPQFRFLGTGFVVGDGKQVATNAHVIAAAPDSRGSEERLVDSAVGLRSGERASGGTRCA
jgi:serine protease Do